MSASFGLFRLQQVDRQLDKSQARLEIIQKTLDNDTELRETLANLDAAKSAHYHAERALKDAEAEVKSQQIKIEQTEASLYGGRVHNPKELQDLQKESASLKKHLSTLEERELEMMQGVENVNIELNQAHIKLDSLQSKLGDEHKQYLEEQTSLKRDMERLTPERDAIVNQLEKLMLEKYAGLRSQKRGIAVAQVIDMACAACGSDINASIQQTARSAAQFAYCPSCGRILYVD